MINPLFFVALFALLGSWILIDPLPGHILLNFPELIGRLTFVAYYNLTTLQPVFSFHIRFFPIRSIIFYADLLEEAIIMSETPLGGEKDGD